MAWESAEYALVGTSPDPRFANYWQLIGNVYDVLARSAWSSSEERGSVGWWPHWKSQGLGVGLDGPSTAIGRRTHPDDPSEPSSECEAKKGWPWSCLTRAIQLIRRIVPRRYQRICSVPGRIKSP